MKKALVRRDLQRLFQVENQEFPVAPPMEWIDCADDVRSETHNFDGEQFVLKPAPPAPDPRLVLDAEECAAVKADNQVIAFLNFTPAQLDNWVDNNVGTAATLTALRTACATAFKVLGRIALQAGRGRSLR